MEAVQNLQSEQPHNHACFLHLTLLENQENKVKNSAWVAVSRVPFRINALPLEHADVVLWASRWMTISK